MILLIKTKMMLLLYLLNVPLRDGGHAYTETNLDRLVVEPWNFVTAALFVAVAVFWFFKIRKEIPRFGFLFAMLILLLIGGVGGTIYHGFRWHRAFLMMDWMPIMIITFSASVYFFIKAWGKWWPPAILLVLFFVLQGLLFNSGLPIQTAINLNYASMAVVVLVPIGWYLVKTGFANGYLVGLALLAFGTALFFRWADKLAWFPMGTHFLWHVFGLVAVHLMLLFLYRTRLAETR
jgi:hemolysin III